MEEREKLLENTIKDLECKLEVYKQKTTFEKIQKANDTIKTTDIKGKDYAEVNQRIKAFRMVYPTGTITTDMISNENGICIFKASVYDELDRIIATGTAYEKENSTFINKTSYIENCETSAVGRALGMAGFGIDTSVASAEEVQNAMANQKEKSKLDKLRDEVKSYKEKAIELLQKEYPSKKLVDLTEEELNKVLEELK